MERSESGDTLQREFRDVFELFRYFVEVDREIYLANDVEVHAGESAIVLIYDAWIWDDRRPHRFVARAEVRTEGPIRVEELAHPQRQVQDFGAGDRETSVGSEES